MAYTRVKPQGDRFYLCEYESYWDPKMGRSRQRFLRYLGPCDRKGNLLAAPRPRVGAVHSAFPVGSLAVFYAAARQLRFRERIREVLGIDEREAAIVLTLGLNQAAARVPLFHLPEWVRASPLPGWLSLDADSLTPRHFEGALSGLCHLTPARTWEDRGLLLQQELTHAWRGSSREPAGAYYDITKQPYYGSHCPYGQLGHDERGTAPVIGFGMVVSKEHYHPILCRTLPGGQNDSLSVAPTLEMLQAQGLRHLLLVMDRHVRGSPSLRARAYIPSPPHEAHWGGLRAGGSVRPVRYFPHTDTSTRRCRLSLQRIPNDRIQRKAVRRQSTDQRFGRTPNPRKLRDLSSPLRRPASAPSAIPVLTSALRAG